MERFAYGRACVRRLSLALILHLLLWLLFALCSVPTYSPLGAVLLVLRFLLPLCFCFAPGHRLSLSFTTPASGLWDAVPVLAILALLGSALPSADTMPEGESIWIGICLVLLTPVCEELLFRGAFVSLLREWDVRISLLLPAALFALLHGGWSILYALMAGLLLGYGLHLGHGLGWCIGVHAVNNLITYLFLLLDTHAPHLYKPVQVVFLVLLCVSGTVIGILRTRAGRYDLPPRHYESEDGAPLPPAALATPYAVCALIALCLFSCLL